MFNKGNITIRLAVFIILTVLCSYTAAIGKVIYVDDDAPDANDGTSWENAYNFLQDALAAALDGDEIRVAQGIYTPDCNSAMSDGTGDREAAFQLISDISLIGGYAGFGELNPGDRDLTAYETILSGDLNGDDVDVNSPDDLDSEPTRAENSFHVVTCSGRVVLDGFTITGGNANKIIAGRSVSNIPDNNGGGIYNPEGQLSLINCTLTRNVSFLNGGGIYNADGELNLVNCTFKGNCAWGSGGSGGGIYDSSDELNLINCTFTGNKAGDSGGGISGREIILADCTFVENYAKNGGGMRCTRGELTMDNCTFINNSASDRGGGVFSGDEHTIFPFLASSNSGGTPNYPGEPDITNCTFIENTASLGAGICNYGTKQVIINCKFIRNANNLRGIREGEGNRGGGMYNFNSSPTIINCVFTDNFSAQDGGGMYNDGRSDLILMNCIFNGNRALLNGGALFINNSQAYLINCTLIWNSAEIGACIMFQASSWVQDTVEIINCICRDGINSIWKEGNAIINVSYSNIQYGWPDEGNIDADPLFVDQSGPDHIPGTEDDDLRLAPVSPCVDTGDPDYVAGSNETDLDGNPRIVGGLLDMGAYEFQGNVYVDDDAPYIIQQRRALEIDNLEEDGSQNRPFDAIQEAIDIAKDGYVILVKPGVYDKIDFRGKAVMVTGTEGAAIIESLPISDEVGFDAVDAVTFHTGEGPGSVLRNFIIRNSNIAISLNFSSPKIHNVTIVDNDFGIAAYENSNPDIRNCILWNNIDGDLFQCEARYSCIENGIGGEGNINVNPLFVDAANGDYHLKSEGWRWNMDSESWTWDDVTSRCIDAGDPSSPLGDELMSVPRDPDNVYGINRCINMGAFGGTYQASMAPIDWMFPADITAPVPDPAEWATGGIPREINIGGGNFDFWVQMTAVEATDDSGLVEYFFECTTESGFSSGWQTSNTYSVKIGRGEQTHRFRVKTRDLYLNETDWSEEWTAY